MFEEVLQIMSRLNHDELAEVIDWIEIFIQNNYQSKQRRKGKTWDITGEKQTAITQYQQLGIGDQKKMILVCKTLLESKRPQPSARQAEGTIETKMVGHWRYHMNGNPRAIDPKKPVIEHGKNHLKEFFGPYLYIRLWHTGARDGKKKRLKSFYIGGEGQNLNHKGRKIYPYRDIALLYATTKSKEIEQRILNCINIERDPPSINHGCLETLKLELIQEGALTEE